MRSQGTRRRWTARTAIAGLVIAGLATIGGGSAQAVHDEAFELDGDQASASVAGGPESDWTDFIDASDGAFGTAAPEADLPDGFLADAFVVDFKVKTDRRGNEVPITSDGSTFTGGSKDTLDINTGWSCVGANNVSDKGDLTNIYAAAYRNASDELILYFGAEKNDASGSNNVGVWFLQDENVACADGATGNGNRFSGQHVNDDILLVSAFTDGGRQANITGYKWLNGALVSLGSGGLCPAVDVSNGDDKLCAITNAESRLDPLWKTWDKDSGSLDDFAAQQFYEGAINVTAFGLNPCITTLLTNTRSSASTTADLYDYAMGSFPVCGDLSVTKYIDADISGDNNLGDTTTGAAVANYTFTVSGPGAPTSTNVVCTGTTDTSGVLSCSTGSLEGLSPGQYTITETQKDGFFNTDAADGTPPAEINENRSVSATVTVGVDGGSFAFGNTCYVDKTFEITNVPATVDSVTVEYKVVGGPNASTAAAGLGYTTLPLAKVGTTTMYKAVVNDDLIQTNTIAWRWYINGDTANPIVVETEGAPESLQGSGYPTCAKTNSDSFDLVTLQGTKYKDFDGGGTFTAPDVPAAGWQFTLKRVVGGIETTIGSPTTSNSAGLYEFTGVEPGVYRIYETAKSGWVQTQPTSTAYRQVTVVLGQSSPVAAGNFLNTPTAKIDIGVTSLAANADGTDAMKADVDGITCVKAAGNLNEAALGDTEGTNSDNGYTSGSVRAGTYTCTVIIIDP